MRTDTENLCDQLDAVGLQEAELFRRRQELVHQALRKETQEGLHEGYLSIRTLEADLRYEHLRLENLLHPGRSYTDHSGLGLKQSPQRKYVYLFLIAAAAVGLLFLLSRA
jgi:hypothetical protein